jgi:L-threonylcarbamoyladenylate synthase
MNEDLRQAIKVLTAGGLILYPTDTIWGIGCDATNVEAVRKIYRLKQREDSKAMIILLDSENRLPHYVREIPEIAWQLIDVSDKPLTIIYPGAKNLASNLIAEMAVLESGL